MINFRFHLISLVAVFLALGVGVAAGASFVDRATVESLQGRVEDLDTAYRERGVELDSTREQLASSDRQAGALAGDQSPALSEQLVGQPVVLVVSDGVPAELLSQVRTSLVAAGAADPTLIRVLADLELSDQADVERVAPALGVEVGDGPDGLRGALLGTLAAALAELAGPAPARPDPDLPAPVAPGPVGEDAPAEPTLVGLAPVDTVTALAALVRLDELGLIAVESPTGIDAAAFGGGTGVRFVELVTASDDVDASTVMVPLAERLAAAAPATLTVARAQLPRPAGGVAPTTSEPAEELPDPLAALRSSPSVERLSTVDDLDDAFGRLAVVYAVALQRASGGVGAFGTGAGTVGPFPTVPGG